MERRRLETKEKLQIHSDSSFLTSRNPMNAQVEQDYEMMKKFISFAEGVIKVKLEK